MGKGALAVGCSGVPGGPDGTRACPLAEGALGRALAGNCLGQLADTEGKGQSHQSVRERSYTLTINVAGKMMRTWGKPGKHLAFVRHSTGHPEGRGALQTVVTHGEIRGQACAPPPCPAGGDGCFLRAASCGGPPGTRTSAGPGGWGLEGGAGWWPWGRQSPRQCLSTGAGQGLSHGQKGPPGALN